MKRICLFISLLIVVFSVSLNATEMTDDTRVNFKDKNLETCVLNNLSSGNVSDYVTEAELSKLTFLKCSGQNISSLNGLEKASSLTYLDLSNNHISSLKFISKLDNLNSLKLSNNDLRNISGVESLDKLMYLDLSNNNISNVSNIQKNKHLKSLDLSSNNISNISSLANLTKLYELKLSGNNINNIKPIANLHNLKYLDLSNNNIKDISILDELTTLEKVDLSYNKVKEMDYLNNNQNLQFLNLEGNQIAEVPNLSNLNELVTFNVNNNQITSISNELPNSLRNLYISNNAIADLSSLSKYDDLQTTALSQEIKLDNTKLDNVNYINYELIDYDGNPLQLKLIAKDIGQNELSDTWYESDDYNSYSGTIYQTVNFKPNQTFTLNKVLRIGIESDLNEKSLERLFDITPLYGQEIYIDDSGVDYNKPGKYNVVVSDEFGVEKKAEIVVSESRYPIDNEGSGFSVDNSNHVQVRLYSTSGSGLPGFEYTITDRNYNVVDVIITDENGYAQSDSLDEGVYYIKQTGAPKEKEIDPNVYKLNVGKVENIVQQLDSSENEYESVTDSVSIYENKGDTNAMLDSEVLTASGISADDLEYSKVKQSDKESSEENGSIAQRSKPTDKQENKMWIGLISLLVVGITLIIRKVR